MSKAVVIKLLNDLLLREYLQRDVYEAYSYYLLGFASPAIQDHLKEHMKEEMKHIKVLQRYLSDLEAPPLLDRIGIPEVKPVTFENILLLDLELEQDAIKRYSKAIQFLENLGSDYMALRIDIENILVEEQEHVHDLNQWLRGNEWWNE